MILNILHCSYPLQRCMVVRPSQAMFLGSFLARMYVHVYCIRSVLANLSSLVARSPIRSLPSDEIPIFVALESQKEQPQSQAAGGAKNTPK
jgi:hypothetical protein